MANITKSTGLFSPELTNQLISMVRGHSSLAKLSGAAPIPFSGTEAFTFDMDQEISIVGEGENKPAGSATFKKKTIVPIKVVYQHRLTNEFMNMADEKQLPYLEAFNDGFAKKIASGFDVMAMHGLNPATKTVSEVIGNNCLDKAVSQKVTYAAATADDNIDEAVGKIQEADNSVTGVAMAPEFAAALGKMKTGNKTSAYPEYRFGGNPGNFGGLNADVNSTVAFNKPTNKAKAYVGDFANCFKWGYADDVKVEIIEYGDPDGQGDLKRTNQICLRAEAFIGWGVLVPEAFAIVEAGV